MEVLPAHRQIWLKTQPRKKLPCPCSVDGSATFDTIKRLQRKLGDPCLAELPPPMPRSSRPSAPRKRAPVTKMMLLPLPAREVTNISLGYHLALQACRDTGGTIEQLRELTRALYVTYYLEPWNNRVTGTREMLFTAARRRILQSRRAAPWQTTSVVSDQRARQR